MEKKLQEFIDGNKMKFCYENYNKSSEMTNGDLLPCKIMFLQKQIY